MPTRRVGARWWAAAAAMAVVTTALGACSFGSHTTHDERDGQTVTTTTTTTTISTGAGGNATGTTTGTTSETTTNTETFTGTSTSGGGGSAGGPAAGGSGGGGGAPSCASLDPDEPVVLYLSADDSNSMASPGHARELLHLGLSPGIPIRTYEFLNYYRIDYPAPPQNQLALFAQAEPGGEAGIIDLQLAVRSFDAIHPRRPMTITFVLDTSGSMIGSSIERERAVVRAVARSLTAGDIVNMVTWSDTYSAILSGHVAVGADDPTVLAAAAALAPGGPTDLHGGLVAGYALASQYYGLTRLNRVVLVSDGRANTGVTDAQLIAQHAHDADQEGIYLVGVGTGPEDAYDDILMDAVTDAGRGAYVYIDSIAEAAHMFVERFDETMEIAARSVQVKLTLPWYLQMKVFHGEEYSPDPTAVEPQHLAPSDAMIFQQSLAACDPALVNGQDPVTVGVSWTRPVTYEVATTSLTMTVDELLASPRAQLHKGKAIVAYAEALKTNDSADLHAARAAALAADPGGTDPELSEIGELVEQHPNY